MTAKMRILLSASIGAVLSLLATLAAAVLYVRIGFSRPTAEDYWFWPLATVLSPAAAVYAPVGSAVGFVIGSAMLRFPSWVAAIVAVATAGAAGATTQWCLLKNAPHISRPLATLLVGSAWSIVAVLAIAVFLGKRGVA